MSSGDKRTFKNAESLLIKSTKNHSKIRELSMKVAYTRCQKC